MYCVYFVEFFRPLGCQFSVKLDFQALKLSGSSIFISDGKKIELQASSREAISESRSKQIHDDVEHHRKQPAEDEDEERGEDEAWKEYMYEEGKENEDPFCLHGQYQDPHQPLLMFPQNVDFMQQQQFNPYFLQWSQQWPQDPHLLDTTSETQAQLRRWARNWFVTSDPQLMLWYQ